MMVQVCQKLVGSVLVIRNECYGVTIFERHLCLSKHQPVFLTQPFNKNHITLRSHQHKKSNSTK